MIRFALIVLLVAGLLGLVLCGLVTGAFLDPTGGYWAVIAPSVWAPFGPFLLLAACGVGGMGLAAWRGGWRRAGVDLALVRVSFANQVFNQIAAGSLGNQIARTLRLRFLERHAR